MDDLNNLRELERIALDILSKEPDLRDARITAIQELADAPAGYPIYVFSAASAASSNRATAAVALNERGTVVPMDSILGMTLKPVLPTGTDLGPGSVDLPRVRVEPGSTTLTLENCEEFVQRIKVVIPPSSAVAKADIYFLADTTGSMGGIIDAVKTGASSILSSLNLLGLDLAYGVGNYKDFPHDAYAFQHQLSPTPTQASVQAAINAWTASGGADTAEGNFYALDQIAENTGGSIGWRAGAKRIIVWFGDAPSHDPICTAISGLGYNITEASVTAKLASQNITVLAVSTNTGPGLDADPVSNSYDYNGVCGAPGGSAGQATRIATTTGGQHVIGINAATITATIINLVQTAINTINNVSLVPNGAIAPFVASIAPAGGYGPLDGRVENVLNFLVTFRGGCDDEARTYVGTLDVVIDGVVRAQHPTSITVGRCGYTYSVKFLCGVKEDDGEECAPVRPGIYATEINIHNPLCQDAVIYRRVIPVVHNGDVIARDPRYNEGVDLGKIELPAHAATMEDCCWLQEPLGGFNRITIGFVEIRSNTPLAVTAVYTVTTHDGQDISLDVETYQPIRG